MSDFTAFLLSVIICGFIGGLVGHFVPSPYVAIPLAFCIGFFGGPNIAKQLLRISK